MVNDGSRLCTLIFMIKEGIDKINLHTLYLPVLYFVTILYTYQFFFEEFNLITKSNTESTQIIEFEFEQTF